ncbi:unnamed protein product [[Candida] boidinii]|nr:unnamed protein product [[Candida] boidinii]
MLLVPSQVNFGLSNSKPFIEPFENYDVRAPYSSSPVVRTNGYSSTTSKRYGTIADSDADSTVYYDADPDTQIESNYSPIIPPRSVYRTPTTQSDPLKFTETDVISSTTSMASKTYGKSISQSPSTTMLNTYRNDETSLQGSIDDKHNKTISQVSLTSQSSVLTGGSTTNRSSLLEELVAKTKLKKEHEPVSTEGSVGRLPKATVSSHSLSNSSTKTSVAPPPPPPPPPAFLVQLVENVEKTKAPAIPGPPPPPAFLEKLVEKAKSMEDAGISPITGAAAPPPPPPPPPAFLTELVDKAGGSGPPPPPPPPPFLKELADKTSGDDQKGSIPPPPPPPPPEFLAKLVDENGKDNKETVVEIPLPKAAELKRTDTSDNSNDGSSALTSVESRIPPMRRPTSKLKQIHWDKIDDITQTFWNKFSDKNIEDALYSK